QAERRHDNPCEDRRSHEPQASSPEGFEPASGHDDEDEVRPADQNYEDERRQNPSIRGCHAWMLSILVRCTHGSLVGGSRGLGSAGTITVAGRGCGTGLLGLAAHVGSCPTASMRGTC